MTNDIAAQLKQDGNIFFKAGRLAEYDSFTPSVLRLNPDHVLGRFSVIPR
jgi:hypothetical protein